MRNDKKSVEAEIQAFGNVNEALKKRAESLKAEVEAKKKKFKEVSAAQKALSRKKEKLAICLKKVKRSAKIHVQVLVCLDPE